MNVVAHTVMGLIFLTVGRVTIAQESEDKEALEEVKVSIPEVLVTGSRILNMDIARSRDDIQPYTVFDRETITNSGAKNIEDFLRNRLTMSTQAGSSSQGVGQGTLEANSSSINLRGLGPDQTLILIDGHRTAGAVVLGAQGQPDLNGIPIAAVERIEVLPTTASGIYGGSATGGVINVILRRDYSGIDTRLTYGGTFEGGGANRQVDLGAGFNLEGGKTNVLLAGSYRNDNPLYVRDRNFTQRAQHRIMSNEPLFYSSIGSPPVGRTSNISSAFGDDLTLKDGTELNSPIAFIPYGYSGAASDAGAALVATAGRYNFDLADTAQQSGGGRSALLGDTTVKSADVTIRREFSSNVQAFVEVGGNENNLQAVYNSSNSAFYIPSSAPNNPFDQDVYVSVPASGMDQMFESKSRQQRAIGGVIVALPKSWRASADYSWSQARASAFVPGRISADGSVAAADGTLDVLRDTNAFPVDFSPYLEAPFIAAPTTSTTKDIALRVAGPLGSLPAGDPVISMLVERRRDSFGNGFLTNAGEVSFYPGPSQSTDSLYLEVQVPLVSPRAAIPGIHVLDLQLAGRRDEYEISGGNTVVVDPTAPLPDVPRFTNKFSSNNPTIGIRYEPVSSLMLRGSYGTGFLPPSAAQIVPGQIVPISAFVSGLLGLTDPLRGGEQVGAIDLITGGKPDLQPEESESWSAGFIWSPQFIPRFRFSADWTKISKEDNIVTLPFGQSTINEELLVSGLVTRGPAADGYNVGPIVALDAGFLNIAHADVEALDLALDYSVESAKLGAFEFSLAATHIISIETQTTESSPIIENAGVATAASTGARVSGGLEWRANGTMVWRHGDVTVGWTTKYFGPYWLSADHSVVAVQGAASIPKQIYHDAFVTWRVPDSQNMLLLSDLEIQLGIQNIFNKTPPIDVVGLSGTNDVGYSLWGDPRLASYFVSVHTTF